MQSENKAEFVNLLNATFEMYGKAQPSNMAIVMYYNALKRFSIDDVKAGLSEHAQNPDEGKYCPKPAHIIYAIEGSSSTRGEQAWTKVDTAIKTVGPHQSVVFDDGLIHAVIDDMGGWVSLCETTSEGYPFKHNEFVKRYQGFINRPPLSIPRKLIGIAEGYNASEGYKVPQPLLIGEAKKAALVYQQGSDSRRVGLTQMGDLPSNVTQLIARS